MKFNEKKKHTLGYELVALFNYLLLAVAWNLFPNDSDGKMGIEEEKRF